MQIDPAHPRPRPRTVVAGLTVGLTLTVFLAFSSPADSAERRTIGPLQVTRSPRTFDVRSRGTAVAIGTRTLRARSHDGPGLGSQAIMSSDPVTGTLRHGRPA